MKKYFFLIVFMFTVFLGSAQSDLEQKIKTLQSQLQEQTQRNDILKEALDLRSSGLEVNVDGITMTLTKVYADQENEKIFVQGLIKYEGEGTRRLQFSTSDLIAPNGDQLIAYTGLLPNEPSKTFAVSKAEDGINYGFLIVFDKVSQKIPTASLLKINLYARMGADVAFNFKGVEIQ